MIWSRYIFFFFFQAEDGIRDSSVTGVQTCALPISPRGPGQRGRRAPPPWPLGAAALRVSERRGGGAAQDAGRTRRPGDGPRRPDDRAGAARGLHVSLELQLLLLMWGTLVGLDLVSVPQAMIARPIVAGPIAGAILGDI